MLKIDPKERPSASDCLNHIFLNESRKLSKSTEKTQVSTHDIFESPARKHNHWGIPNLTLVFFIKVLPVLRTFDTTIHLLSGYHKR